jgi:ubiquinone biosynthesis protein COQ4
MLNKNEAGYLMGQAAPVTSSILTSSSAYLNNPLFRDLFAQMGLKRDGNDLPGAYLIPEIARAFTEVTDDQALDAMLDAEKRRLPEFAKWLDNRFVSAFEIDSLSVHLAGTLGAEIYKFVLESGMKIDFMFLDAPRSDMEYLNKRRVQVHDIEHMVTGFDPSPVGEIALIVANMIANTNYFSFDFAAELNRFGAFLVSTGLMRMSCHYPSVVPSYLEAISLGRSLGEKQASPMWMLKWEEYLDWPIKEITQTLGFTDGPPRGYWNWTDAAAKG